MASYFPSLRDRMIDMTDDLPKINKTVGSIAKETAPVIGHIEAPVITEIGKEIELPLEVAKSGVTIQSDSIELPPPVTQLGVKSVGVQATTTVTTTTVALPLTDDQIAQGLHQSIMSSWRWLSEWCMRQLHAAHKTIKSIHGKVTRTEG